MRRRDFLKATVQGSLAGTLTTFGRHQSEADPIPPPAGASALSLSHYTAEDHRRRLEHLALAERSIHSCLRQHLVTDYLPGQCCYNLGEYPCRKPWNPDHWDEQELDRLRAHGIQLLQVHEEWNDSQRLFGGHKLTALNPRGFHRFVDMVHRRGMKLLVYASSGFFQRTDPDFRDAWAHGSDLREIYYQYAHCSPASPGWRAYLLPRLQRILDDYGVDGFYNDLGYVKPAGNAAIGDQVPAFAERADHDGALGDLLALIYAEVKRRGGIIKIHYGAAERPQTELKVYDYLWVGESVTSGDSLRQAVKNFPPYVVPCLDMSRAAIGNEDELYLQSIPYLQFPLLLAGRPFTGERARIPGVQYPPEEQCFWTRHCREIWRHYQAHPEGPHSYGWWDSCPGRPQARPTHARWLKHYLPMVAEGTWAWLEIKDSTLFTQPLPPEVMASVFANRELYLVLANYGKAAVEVTTAAPYVSVSKDTAPAGKTWQLEPRSLQILQRTA
jgi:hypothetical protein